MFEFIEAKIGRWAIAVGAAVLVIVLLVLHFIWHRRIPLQPGAPIAAAPGIPGSATPSSPSSRPAAVAQATAATTTHVHIVIRRWPRSWPAAPSGSGVPDRVATASGSVSPQAPPSVIATDSPPIEIDVTTTSTASSTAAATASAPSLAAAVTVAQHPMLRHGRIGVLAATVPGVLAIDVEALQFRTPWWLVGQPLEVGLDAEANLAEAGAGISVGSNVYVEAGGFTTYRGGQRGLYLGGGLRL